MTQEFHFLVGLLKQYLLVGLGWYESLFIAVFLLDKRENKTDVMVGIAVPP